MKTSASNQPDAEKNFFIKFSKLESRWDPNYYRYMRRFWERMNHCTFPLQHLGKSLSHVQYGISVRATEEPVGVPMLRMANLQDNSWDISELKYIELSEKEKEPYLLKQGDLLFNRTNSKELVGKCNVFNLPGEYVFASYLIRVRLKEESLLPDYVTAYLASSLGRLQIDAVSRQIAGMTNINAEEIRDLFIPSLDLPTQRKVADAWQTAIQKRDQTLAEARAILLGIDDVLLTELGIKLQPESPDTIENRRFYRRFSDLSGERLDPIANQDKRMRFVEAIHSSDFPVRPLRQIVNFSKRLVNSISPTDIYIGLENIDGETGEFLTTAEKESISTAIQFEPGQILFPKLRPYLNKTHLATFNGLCSTEFHVFTPLSIRADYLTWFLRSRAIVGITSLLMTGNTLPRLQMADIERLPIPIPPLPVQEKLSVEIVRLKNEAAALRAKATEELAKAKQSIESLILGEGGQS